MSEDIVVQMLKEASPMAPANDELLNSILSCVENGQRLIDEGYDLEFRQPPSSRYFLTMIAQEEFAKAFILFLVREGIAHLNPAVLRAMKDHSCKQLVGMIMDYVIMHWDEVEELEALVRKDSSLGDRLPNDVRSAMELLRFEKIGRWESNNWVWDEEPDYERSALSVYKGQKDRRKQDALYVRIDRNGRVCSTPTVITEDESRAEFERAKRFKRLIDAMVKGEESSRRYDRAMMALRELFEFEAG
jgi:AbiV family abortive infection protein